MMKTIRERLMAKVSVKSEKECWNWNGCRLKKGYGQMWDGERLKLAHRVSYEVYIGPIEGGMFVCHRCDNPVCVNPAHLFLGTNAENMADKVSKGRQSRKLKDADVAAIRSASGVTQQELAKQFNVGQDQISRIRSGKRWKLFGTSLAS
jgi:hypothetical protein